MRYIKRSHKSGHLVCYKNEKLAASYAHEVAGLLQFVLFLSLCFLFYRLCNANMSRGSPCAQKNVYKAQPVGFTNPSSSFCDSAETKGKALMMRVNLGKRIPADLFFFFFYLVA